MSLKPNIIQMLMIAKDIGIDHLEDAYNNYQRHYYLFFLIDDFAAQDKKFTEDLPVSADIGYMCLVGFNLHIFTENGWVNAGKLTEIDLDLYAHIDGGLFTDESGVEIGESGLEALQSHIIDANTHTNLIVDGTEV